MWSQVTTHFKSCRALQPVSFRHVWMDLRWPYADIILKYRRYPVALESLRYVFWRLYPTANHKIVIVTVWNLKTGSSDSVPPIKHFLLTNYTLVFRGHMYEMSYKFTAVRVFVMMMCLSCHWIHAYEGVSVFVIMWESMSQSMSSLCSQVWNLFILVSYRSSFVTIPLMFLTSSASFFLNGCGGSSSIAVVVVVVIVCIPVVSFMLLLPSLPNDISSFSKNDLFLLLSLSPVDNK